MATAQRMRCAAALVRYDSGADATATSILRRIESLGYAVKIFRINNTVELHAVSTTQDVESQIARCNDGSGDDEAYRAACLLAVAVGIHLEHG